MKILQIIFLLLATISLNCQTTDKLAYLTPNLNAYDDFNKFFGENSYEVPDCIDPQDHISIVNDAQLNSQCYAFTLHVTPDNDRCQNFDRQRNEIKVFSGSEDWMKGIDGSQMSYSWKFKIDTNFQYSSKFSHIHQIKSNVESSQPFVTITAASGLIRLQVMSANVKTVSIEEFRGQWVQVHEKVIYGKVGYISQTINRLSDGVELLSYEGQILDFFDGTLMRPKWGLYRSLSQPEKLRDETLFFTDICIAEGLNTCQNYESLKNNLIQN